MAWYATAAKVTLAAGALLLSSGCGERQKMAISYKDEEIRQQKDLIAAEQARVAQAQREKDETAAMNAKLADQNKELALTNGAMAAKNASETAQLRQQIGDLDAKLTGMNGQLTKLNTPSQHNGTDNSYVRGADGSIRIIVANTTLFDSGKADLKNTSHTMLADVAKTLRTKFPNNYVRIEGHTDSTPVVHNKAQYKDNMALSIARSRAVYDQLIKDGIPAQRLYTAGYGASQPLVPEKTVADRTKNRRVEIVIMPTDVKIEKSPLAAANLPVKSPAAKK